MRTVARKPTASRQAKPFETSFASTALRRQRSEPLAPLQWQRMTENWFESDSQSPERASGATTTRLARDFSLTPAYAEGSAAKVPSKLGTSAPHDDYEREADRVADDVMRVPEATCAKCQTTHHHQKYARLAGKRGSGTEIEDLRAPESVRDVLTGPSRPLDPAARSFFETRFGHDFSTVRVHSDSKAAESARAMNAHAYTWGRNIVFDHGRFAPHTEPGARLLAHELAHVVQQQPGETPRIARQKASLGEKWGALWGAGPIDSYRAKKIADEALTAARLTGLPGLHNGPADAWRHCYWNCRMVQVIGKEDAADIAENHEAHGGNSTAERMMDTWNNEEGRDCKGDCDTACQSKLDGGELWVLYPDKDGEKVGASKPTLRGKGAATGEKYDKY